MGVPGSSPRNRAEIVRDRLIEGVRPVRCRRRFARVTVTVTGRDRSHYLIMIFRPIFIDRQWSDAMHEFSLAVQHVIVRQQNHRFESDVA